MASHGISWVLGTHVRFRNLDFIIMVGGELALAHAAIQSLSSIGLNHERLERQLGGSLGPQQSREVLRRLTLFDANGTAWFSGGGSLSLEHHIRSAPIAPPFGLRNAVATVSHLVARRMVLLPANNGFMGVIEHITESLHNLLTEGPGSSSSSDSSRGSQHPSWECFMAGTPEGNVESILAEEVTPMGNLGNETKGETAAPPCIGVEQPKAQQWEIK